MKFKFLLLFLTLYSVSSGAITLDSGKKKVQLLELYSSQGCSSCPPAQSWLNQFKDSAALWKKLVPVVFHVDYWDYLGWQDPYGLASYSLRQRRFKQLGLARSVYTPGFMLNGKEWRGWFKRKPLAYTPLESERLVVEVHNGQLKAGFSGEQAPLTLNVAVLGMGVKTRVKAGENKHKELSEEFIVLDFQQITSKNPNWNNIKLNTEFAVPKLALAVWVTEQYQMLPLQAVGGWLPLD